MEDEKKVSIDSYLTFKLGKELFAANVEKVLHILAIPEITRVPNAPTYMMGVINFRGKVLPVIETSKKFNMDDTVITSSTCIIVIEIPKGDEIIQIGAVVDSVSDVLQISEKDIQPSPNIGEKYQSNFIEGMIEHNKQFIILLNMENVFSTDELVDIDDNSNTKYVLK
ncbi:MAG: chemotaxis protein CheW [Bacteroidota bacterium]|nr:chemotaxis protein CheW [Bacteroidota bacterium]